MEADSYSAELVGQPAVSFQDIKESGKQKKSQGIPFHKPTLSKNELKSVLECMVQDEISYGRVAVHMEKEFANAFEFRKALSAPSLTSAYHLALMSLELVEGDEVIMAANAPVAALDAVGQVGATPVLVDIDRKSFHPAHEEIQAKVNGKTAAIVISYPYGAFHDYEPVREWLQTDEAKAQRTDAVKDVKIIEDLSYIAGSEYLGRYIGTDADIAVIGLHAEMMMTTGKGAVLLTDSRNLAAQMKDLRMHGGSNRPYRLRYDYSITDYQAAMGIEQLGNLAQILERRKKLGHRYLEAVSDSKLHSFFRHAGEDAFGSFPIIMETPIEHGMSYFKSLRIEVRRTSQFGPLHNLMGLPATDFPNAERVYQRGLLIPLYPYLTKMNVERIVGSLRAFY